MGQEKLIEDIQEKIKNYRVLAQQSRQRAANSQFMATQYDELAGDLDAMIQKNKAPDTRTVLQTLIQVEDKS